MPVERTKLLIVGAGQYAQVVRDIAISLECYAEIAFVDDRVPLEGDIIGRTADLEALHGRFAHAIVAIGNPALRRELTERLLDLGYEVPVLVHPRGWVSPTATVAPGCVVEASSVINAYVALGTATLVCAGAVVNHNAVVGPYCQIDCNATVPARGNVPENTKLSAGTVFQV